MRSARLLAMAVLTCTTWSATLAHAQTGPEAGAVPPEAAAYATPATPTPAPVVVSAPGARLASPPPPPTFACPGGSQQVNDAYGRPTCVTERRVHAVDGVWLGLGIGALAGGYVALYVGTLVTTSASGSFGRYSGDYTLWGDVPLLGPWVQMGYFPDHTDAGQYVWNSFVGLLEIAGLVALIYGAIGEERVEMRPLPGYVLRVTPILGTTTAGLAATLTF